MTIQQAILANPNATDAEILAIVNAPVAKKIDLPSVRRLLAKDGTDVVIDDNRENPDATTAYYCKRASKFMTLIFRDDMVQLGEDHDQFMQLASALLSLGIISQQIYTSLNALAFAVPTQKTESEVAWARRQIVANNLIAEWDAVDGAARQAIADWLNGSSETPPTIAELRAI